MIRCGTQHYLGIRPGCYLYRLIGMLLQGLCCSGTYRKERWQRAIKTCPLPKAFNSAGTIKQNTADGHIRHFHRMNMGVINFPLNHFNAFFPQNAGHLIAAEVTVKVDHGVNLSFTGNKLRQMLAIFGKWDLSIEAKILASFLGFPAISAGKTPIRFWIFVDSL